ncbi:hypothetical protein HY388_01995 [Candidatus Daviesbacteria bacterium]|nr:hypothetical protein [Candidatus Daviesbacteria bacterium]
MKLVVSDAIFESFANITIGAIVGFNLDNNGDEVTIGNLQRQAEREVRQAFSQFASVAEHPTILAWRNIYRKFGCDPHDYRSSIEALVRRAARENPLPHINKLVDLYNYISLKYLLAVGGEDLDKIDGDLIFNFASGREEFIPLGQTANDPPVVGEVIYKDNSGAVCRRWNWREGDRTKLTEQTKNAILVFESPDENRQNLDLAMAEFELLAQKYCQGNFKKFIIDREHPSAAW